MARSLPVPRPWIQALVLVLLAVGSYWSSLDNDFFFDDETRIVENPGIRHLTPATRFLTNPRLSAAEKRLANYRPLLALSLALDYARGGLDPRTYHRTQLAIHAAATLATWAGLAALLGSAAPGAAFWAAALLATHPVSGVAVRYISARDLLQMQLFLMAGLALYLWRRRHGGLTRGTWAGVLALYCLSLLSKKNGVVLPALILWIECVLPDASGEPPGWRVGLRRALVFLLPVILVGGAARWFLGHDETYMVLVPGEPVSPGYLATQAWSHWRHYLLGFVAPWTLQLEAQVPRLGLTNPRAWLGGGAILFTLGAAWRARRRQPEAATCVVAYWLLLVPTSSLLHLYAPVVPYRPYPSSAFLYGGVAFALAGWPRGPWIARALVAACVVAALATDSSWQNSQAVWSHSVARGGSAKAHTALALHVEDPVERARLLEHAIRSDTDQAMAGLALAEAWIGQGRRDEALKLVRRIRDQTTTQSRYQEIAGRLLLSQGEFAEALATARVAYDLDPEGIAVRLVLAKALQMTGDTEASAHHLEYVARESPGFRDVDLRRGYVAETRGDLARAEALYAQHLARSPGDGVASRYLGGLLFRQGRFAEAVPLLETAHREGQESRELDRELWACYRQLGNSSSASEVLARLRRSPGR